MAKNVETWWGWLLDKYRETTESLDKLRQGIKRSKDVKRYKDMDKKDKLASTKLYRWGNEKLTKEQVMELVGWIPNPYGREFVERIENGDIKWLQKFLNGIVDKLGLWRNTKFKVTLKSKGMRLKDGKHILEDWKLGPQTMETLKFLAENRSFFEQLGDTYFSFLSWKSRLY